MIAMDAAYLSANPVLWPSQLELSATSMSIFEKASCVSAPHSFNVVHGDQTHNNYVNHGKAPSKLHRLHLRLRASLLKILAQIIGLMLLLIGYLVSTLGRGRLTSWRNGQRVPGSGCQSLSHFKTGYREVKDFVVCWDV